MAGEASRLDRVYSAYESDGSFVELRLAATQLVRGSGSLVPSLMFVGEAPGANEDRRGLPFVGNSGGLLNAMLEHIRLRRNDVFITNIVKYRPPHNRDPLPKEIRASLPYLRREVQILRPDVLVTLGRISFNAILPKAKLANMHGMSIRLTTGLVLYPLWHPAYVLRNNRRLRDQYEEEFAALKEFL